MDSFSSITAVVYKPWKPLVKQNKLNQKTQLVSNDSPRFLKMDGDKLFYSTAGLKFIRKRLLHKEMIQQFVNYCSMSPPVFKHLEDFFWLSATGARLPSIKEQQWEHTYGHFMLAAIACKFVNVREDWLSNGSDIYSFSKIDLTKVEGKHVQAFICAWLKPSNHQLKLFITLLAEFVALLTYRGIYWTTNLEERGFKNRWHFLEDLITKNFVGDSQITMCELIVGILTLYTVNHGKHAFINKITLTKKQLQAGLKHFKTVLDDTKPGAWKD